jgi:hypothetical protein
MSSIRGTSARTAFALLVVALTAATAHAGFRIEMEGIEILIADGRLRRSIPNGAKDAPGGAIKWRKVQIREL